MRTLNFQLVGMTPIILHHIARHELREEIRSTLGSELSLEDEAREVMSKDRQGNPVVPIAWISDALRIGCSRVLDHGKQLSFFKLQNAISFSEEALPLRDTDNKIPQWKVYTSIQHASPGSKKSIAVVAPIFKDWMLLLPIRIKDSEPFFDENVLKKILLEAGKCGIGLFHPPKKQFGQFEATLI